MDIAGMIADSFMRDPVTGLIFMTLVRMVRVHGDQQRAPVSTRTLAEAVDLPFETVRRYVRDMRRSGHCDTASDGVWIPQEVYETAPYRYARRRLWAEGVHFLKAAEQAGLAPAFGLASRIEPTKGAIRALRDFFLDALGVVRKTLDLNPIQVFVLAAVWTANIRSFLEISDPGAAYAELNEIPADHLRAPVSAYAVAKTLGLPYETVRRTLAGLIDVGLAESTRGGVIIPARVPASPKMMEMIEGVGAMTRALLDVLSIIAELQDGETIDIEAWPALPGASEGRCNA